jgi:hypothetical protein
MPDKSKPQVSLPPLPQDRFCAWLLHGEPVNAFNWPVGDPQKWDRDGYWASKGFTRAPLFTADQTRAYAVSAIGGITLAADHSSMRVNYAGLLNQARAALRGSPGLAEMLRQLQEHLEELGQRWYAGDTDVVDEILQLYCIEREARQALMERGHA